MGRERFYEHTNIYAIEEGMSNIGFYEVHDAYWKEMRKNIDEAFEAHDVESLLNIFHDFRFQTFCRPTSEFAEFFMGMEIFEEELLYEENKTIFENCDKLENMIEKLTEVKYALLRVEFSEGEEVYTHLINVIERYEISATFLRMMVNYINYQKTKISLILGKFLMNCGLLRYAQALLINAKDNNGTDHT